MNPILSLAEDQRDALQEIVNIGMGTAGDSLARVMGEFVELSVPRVVLLAAADISTALQRLAGQGEASAVRQAFHGFIRGEGIVIYGSGRCADLASLMGYEDVLDATTERELLLDVSNVLIGACIGGVCEQLGGEVGFSAPSLLADRVPAADLLRPENMAWSHALLIEVHFSLEQRSFACQMIVLMPEESINIVRAALNRFLESL